MIQYEYPFSIEYQEEDLNQLGQMNPKSKLRRFLEFNKIINQEIYQIWENELQHSSLLIQFFSYTINEMIIRILNHRNILPGKLNFLTKENSVIQVSRKQVFCLLSLSFLNFLNYDKKFSQQLNLSQSFKDVIDSTFDSDFQKILCIINYFNLYLERENEIGEQMILLNRYSVNGEIQSHDFWLKSTVKLSKIQIDGKNGVSQIENAMIIDFANKYIGGGVLRGGCVQEEILFVCHPESIISCFLCPVMEDNESIQIKNVKEYSSYKGYAEQFRFDGPDPKFRSHTLIAIDALKFYNPKVQYDKGKILREVVKSYAAYSIQNSEKTFATGNWGCGAFRGNHYLKFLIQWISFSVASNNGEISLIYCSFSDKLGQQFQKLLDKFNNFTVGELYKFITSEGVCQSTLWDLLQ